MLWFTLISVALAYVSRPDLDPPALNVTANAGDLDGYIFLGPYLGTLAQPGGYIYDFSGELVWLGHGRISGWAGNLQVTEYQGQTVLQLADTVFNVAGFGRGHTKLLSQNYTTLTEIYAGDAHLADFHEFKMVGNDSAVVTMYQPTPVDLSVIGGPSEGWVFELIFREIDVVSGDTKFEWRALDHVKLEDTLWPVKTRGNSSTNAFDYFHINSVDKDGDDYVISSRYYSTVYKIDGKTGDIIWRLVGNQEKVKLDFAHDFQFDKQHDARLHNGTTLTIFDNAMNISDVSSAKIISLDQNKRQATLVALMELPEHLHVYSQGNNQLLPDGGLFVNWGSLGAVTKFNLNHEVVFHATLPEKAQSYRGFQFDWQGTLPEAVAVAVDAGKVFVLWNGDTRVTTWTITKDDKPVVSAPRKGFETVLDLNVLGTYKVVGYDKEGQQVGESSEFTVNDDEVKVEVTETVECPCTTLREVR